MHDKVWEASEEENRNAITAAGRRSSDFDPFKIECSRTDARIETYERSMASMVVAILSV